MKNSDKTEVITRIVCAILLNSFIWITLKNWGLIEVNTVVAEITYYSFLMSILCMFCGAIYLSFDKEKLKIARQVTLFDLKLILLTTVLFVVLFLANMMFFL